MTEYRVIYNKYDGAGNHIYLDNISSAEEALNTKFYVEQFILGDTGKCWLEARTVSDWVVAKVVDHG